MKCDVPQALPQIIFSCQTSENAVLGSQTGLPPTGRVLRGQLATSPWDRKSAGFLSNLYKTSFSINTSKSEFLKSDGATRIFCAGRKASSSERAPVHSLQGPGGRPAWSAVWQGAGTENYHHD